MHATALFDLGIEGATIVGPNGRLRANLYVSGGHVAAITKERLACEQSIDASGAMVMPGMVDAHVHLMDPGETSREDFPTGTAAAAVAGVTSLIEHTHSAPVRTVEDLIEKRSYLEGRSHTDFGLGAHAWDQDQDLAALWNAGASFFKAFTCTTHGVPGWSYGSLRGLFSSVAAVGAVCLVHSEDESLTSEAEARLRSDGRSDGGVVSEWRNREAEAVAVAGVVLLADQVGARVVLAHVSSADAVDTVRRLQRPGSRVFVESCPQYMELLENEVAERGAFRKFTPPARAQSEEDLRDMWRALESGRIDYISSDHAPSTRSQKGEADIWDAPFGLPGLDTTMPVLLTAAAAGELSYERLVEVYSEVPAKVYGFYPRKGSLAVGSDADMVIVDPMRKWTLTDDDIRSKAGWSPYSGKPFVGKAVKSYVRGNLVADEGEVTDESLSVGRFVAPNEPRTG